MGEGGGQATNGHRWVSAELRQSWDSAAEASPEKVMAPPLQYSCLENPMDGGAW